MPDRSALFWAKVRKTDTCWLWMGAIDREGYGRFRTDTGQIGAHRYSYGQAHDGLPDLPIDHLCRVRHCVRPSHLEAVTSAENQRRAMAEARRARVTCGHGHVWADGNEYVLPSGKRYCRSCNRANVAAYETRKRSSS